MASLNMVNRLPAMYGLEPLFTFDERREVALIAKRIVDEYFEAGLDIRL